MMHRRAESPIGILLVLFVAVEFAGWALRVSLPVLEEER
jgi:hypothetical protein